MDLGWIVASSGIVGAAVGALLWRGAQSGLIAVVEKSVAAKFDKDLEAVRSDLRTKEAAIAALQSAALSGRAGRQSMMDKRRIEAIEILWGDVIILNAFLWPTKMTEHLKLDAIASQMDKEPNLKQFMDIMGGGDLTDKLRELKGEAVRMFLPSEVWSLFSAYQGLLIYCYMRIKASSFGVGKNMFKEDEILNDIKKVLPHFSQYLDEYGLAGAAGLARNLRDLVLDSLKVTIKNLSSDQEEIEEIHDIMARVRNIGLNS